MANPDPSKSPWDSDSTEPEAGSDLILVLTSVLFIGLFVAGLVTGVFTELGVKLLKLKDKCFGFKGTTPAEIKYYFHVSPNSTVHFHAQPSGHVYSGYPAARSMSDPALSVANRRSSDVNSPGS